MNDNNIRMSNNTITLNLSSGGGRQTLPEWDDASVEITTTWSNGKTASDTSTCKLPAITLDAPTDFYYNDTSVQLIAGNVPTGVTLTGVSIKNLTTQAVVNLNGNNWSVS